MNLLTPPLAPSTTTRSTMDNQGSRPRAAKRTRISRACNPCRSRKRRCDGRQPSCSACSSTQHPCSYDSGMKKRGLPTGYVRSLELLWALMFTVIPQSMRIVTQLIPDIQFALDSHGKLVMVSRFVKDPGILQQTWEDSGIQTTLDNLLSNASDNFNTDATSTSIESKPASTVDLLQSTVGLFEANQIQVANGGRHVPDPVLWPAGINNGERLSYQQLFTAHTSPADPVVLSSFLPHTQRLLDLYFTHTHSWLPMVQKHKMYEILYSPSRPVEAGGLATFWAISAYASLQASCEPFSPVSPAHGCGVFLTPDQIYLQARHQIPNEEAQEPGYVQALLILSLFNLHGGEIGKAWRLIGQAVRLLLDLGTLFPKSYGSNTARYSGNDDERIKLLLSCFVLDTVVSCHLHKPPHLRTMDIRSLPMPAETGPDEWEPPIMCLGESQHQRPSSFTCAHQPLRALSIFNHYVGIISILNDIISEPLVGVSDAACAKHSSALRRWYDQLPRHCIFPSSSSKNRIEGAQQLSPQLINLHLAFKSTEMLLKAQQASIPRHGPAPSTPDTETSSLTITSLISMFTTNFRVSTMPVTFTSYKFISGRKATAHNSFIPSSPHTRPDHPGGCQPRASSSDMVVPYSPTPMEGSEFALTGVSGIGFNSGLSSSCEAPEGMYNQGSG